MAQPTIEAAGIEQSAQIAGRGLISMCTAGFLLDLRCNVHDGNLRTVDGEPAPQL